jgi:hypothetical protein
MLSEEMSTESQTPQIKTFRAGMWAAIFVAISPILYTGITLGTIYGGMLYNQLGSRSLLWLMNTAGYLQSGLSLLETLAFVVVMACLQGYAPPGKRVWVQIGFIIALIYALVLFLNFLSGFVPVLRYSMLERVLPAMDSRLRPFVFGTLIYSLMGLAMLFAIPAFSRGGLERAIRWGLGISGALLIAAVVGMAFNLGMQPNATLSLVTMVIRVTLYPLTMALIAAAFRRATKAQPG